MKRLLVVDDDSDVREIVCYALSHEGYDVLGLENGKKALDYLIVLEPENYPGLIIIDSLMPEMDGLSFIQHVKSDFPDTLATIPLPLSSARHTTVSGVESLSKPLDLDQLLLTVKRLYH